MGPRLSALLFSQQLQQHTYKLAGVRRDLVCFAHLGGDTDAGQPARRRPQGLPTPAYYLLAALSSLIAHPADCNSSRSGGPKVSCIFRDVTQGDNDAPCEAGSPNCYAPGGTLGVLSKSTTSYQPAFEAGTGWDFPTGLGTPNVANLVLAWPD
jgi:hypothetical protein